MKIVVVGLGYVGLSNAVGRRFDCGSVDGYMTALNYEFENRNLREWKID